MKKIRTWFLVGLVLVLVIGWNIDCLITGRNVNCKKHKETIIAEPPPYFKHQINEFLGKILDRILQGIPNNNEHYFSIEARFRDYFPDISWAGIYVEEEKIIINRRAILVANNEAELATLIAHEVGHTVAPDFLPKSLWPLSHKGNRRFSYGSSFITVRYRPYRIFLGCFKEELIDRTGIELMARAGYNVYSALDIALRRCNYYGINPEEVKEEKERLSSLRINVQKYFKEDQKKWQLFTFADLKQVQEYLVEYSDGLSILIQSFVNNGE